MILYRAINIDDINNLNNNNNIYSSIINSYIKSKEKEIRKNIYNYYNACIKGSKSCALDTIIGHISGKRISAKISPWISTTTDFDIAAQEYAIPQSGTHNYSKDRKPIILIDYPDDKILSTKEEVFKLRNNIIETNDFSIDLRNDNLNELFVNEAIMAEKYNEQLPGYDVVAYLNRTLLNYKTVVIGFSKYAKAAKEILIYAQIKKDYIKAILDKELVEITYSCNIDKEFIINNYKELNDYLKKLDNEFLGNNLIDYLKQNYNTIRGNNIEEKYEYLKQIKKTVLSKIIESLNKKYNTNYKVIRLLDDKILVKCYDNIIDLNTSLKNDLILIEKNNKIYEHNFKKHGFYNEDNDELITSKEIVKMIKTKVR